MVGNKTSRAAQFESRRVKAVQQFGELALAVEVEDMFCASQQTRTGREDVVVTLKQPICPLPSVRSVPVRPEKFVAPSDASASTWSVSKCCHRLRFLGTSIVYSGCRDH